MRTIPLHNARVRLLVRHIDSGEWIQNKIVTRGLRDAILLAHDVTRDGNCSAFIAINEMVVGFYVRGAHSRYRYEDEHGLRHKVIGMPLPAELRRPPMSHTDERTAWLPGLEHKEERRIA